MLRFVPVHIQEVWRYFGTWETTAVCPDFLVADAVL
jgi:hypothetical protein